MYKPEITKDLSAKIIAELIKQFEDQYQVTIEAAQPDKEKEPA